MSLNRSLDWQDYIDDDGLVELPKYIYTIILHLMKYSLDLGTLFAESEDDPQLKAFRNRVKNEFKDRWVDIAEVLEYMELIVPCGCSWDDYCLQCHGARFLLDKNFSADVIHEISTVVREDADDDLAIRLQQELAEFLATRDEYD